MKSVFALSAIALFTVAASGNASAKTTCEDVIAKIEAKIQAKGVKSFTLTAIGKDEKTDLRVVGTCDGGAKKIVYERGKAAAAK
ncbi:MAG: DUF1161 domain-containing protein [Betaproteobacteria bacterium]|nr:DUF1161 domain-containing protein [Betaproteobacteria bacterium]